MAVVTAQPPLRRPRLEAGLDLGEKLFVIALFARLAYGMFHAVGLGASWLNYLQLGAEGIVVALILLRRPASEVSLNPVDWVLAVAATGGPLLIRADPRVASFGPPVVAAILMIGGLALQICAKLTLRLSFGVAPANRGLTTVGPYALVRHPIYLAYLMGWCGFLLLNPTAWNASVLGASLVIQVMRLQAEERLLARDPAFAEFRSRVRFRLMPGLW